jgi:hypothetical protein
MPKINIKSGLTIFKIVFAIGFSAVVLTSHAALSNLKVGGPIYDKISQGKDLVAHILPLPDIHKSISQLALAVFVAFAQVVMRWVAVSRVEQSLLA